MERKNLYTDKYALENNLREELKSFCDFCEENGRPMDYSLIDQFLKK